MNVHTLGDQNLPTFKILTTEWHVFTKQLKNTLKCDHCLKSLNS